MKAQSQLADFPATSSLNQWWQAQWCFSRGTATLGVSGDPAKPGTAKGFCHRPGHLGSLEKHSLHYHLYNSEATCLKQEVK